MKIGSAFSVSLLCSIFGGGWKKGMIKGQWSDQRVEARMVWSPGGTREFTRGRGL